LHIVQDEFVTFNSRDSLPGQFQGQFTY